LQVAEDEREQGKTNNYGDQYAGSVSNALQYSHLLFSISNYFNFNFGVQKYRIFGLEKHSALFLFPIRAFRTLILTFGDRLVPHLKILRILLRIIAKICTFAGKIILDETETLFTDYRRDGRIADGRMC
jgi:hypothetical protein